jgi:hypothetical protein
VLKHRRPRHCQVSATPCPARCCASVSATSASTNGADERRRSGNGDVERGEDAGVLGADDSGADDRQQPGTSGWRNRSSLVRTRLPSNGMCGSRAASYLWRSGCG